MEISKASENKPILDFQYIEKQLNNHGLETPETIKLRDKIKKFFKAHQQEIEQAIGTDQFSVMLGGSLQAGTADSYSDIDLTIIINTGDTGQIWSYGGLGETIDGIRGIFLFRPDSLKQIIQRNVDINLLSIKDTIKELENLEFLVSKDDRFLVIDNIVRIFSPQLYEKKTTIYSFRKSIIQKLNTIPNGEKIWNNIIVPQFKEHLIQHSGDCKGENWPEREQRSRFASSKKKSLLKKIAERLSTVRIPNFQEMKTLYKV